MRRLWRPGRLSIPPSNAAVQLSAVTRGGGCILAVRRELKIEIPDYDLTELTKL